MSKRSTRPELSQQLATKSSLEGYLIVFNSWTQYGDNSGISGHLLLSCVLYPSHSCQTNFGVIYIYSRFGPVVLYNNGYCERDWECVVETLA